MKSYYRTTLYYTCGKCEKEHRFECKEQGPQFCIEGWMRISIDGHVYHPEGNHFRDEKRIESIFCPDCVKANGFSKLVNFMSIFCIHAPDSINLTK